MDESLIDQLVNQHYTYLLRVAASIVRDEAVAEEIVQEAFVTALTRIDKLYAESNFRGWLSTIVVNRCRDWLRRQKVRQKWLSVWAKVKIGVPSTSLRTGSAEIITINQEITHELWQAVDQLDDKHRLPIILRYQHNLPVREIARLLNVKEGTIHSRLHYGCRRLAGQLLREDVF